jgi:glycosyltransferase involved in cell wall biosynthesis
LKVLYLTPPARGGTALAAQSFVAEEIRAIRDWGVQPFVLTDEITGHARLDGIDLAGLPRGGVLAVPASAAAAVRHARVLATVMQASAAKRDVIHALRLEQAAAALVRRERIDVIHSHFGWPGGFGGSLAAADTDTPLVTSIRGTDILMRPAIGYGLRLDPGYDVALRHLLDRASVSLTATGFMSDRAVALGAPSQRVRVLEKGVDTEAFAPRGDRDAIKVRLGIAGPMVLAVGALKKRKGVDVIIEAMARVSAQATLVVCGEGEERDALRRQADAAGMKHRVRFEGAVGRAVIPDYFAAADVFVHAAELEAAGNVVLEALASGCGVVVTDSGGPAEYVEDGVNGYVIAVGDVPNLAGRIEALLSEPARRERLGAEGRRRVEARYRYSRMMSDLRAIYDAWAQPRCSRSMRAVANRASSEQTNTVDTSTSAPAHARRCQSSYGEMA